MCTCGATIRTFHPISSRCRTCSTSSRTTASSAAITSRRSSRTPPTTSSPRSPASKDYARYLDQIGKITEQRDELAGQIKTVLNNAEFHNQSVDNGSANGLGNQAKALINRVKDLADSHHDD